MPIRALLHASELLTGAGIRAKDGRHPKESDLDRIPDGAVVYHAKTVRSGGVTREVPGKILWVGPTSELPKKYSKAARKNLKGKHAVVPGLIDAHTHLVFAGDRSEEFALRCGGVTYEEIARRGGGIQTTVNATRAASLEELTATGIARARESYAYGVRTLEIKSGYGLDWESERKLLKAAQAVRKAVPEMSFKITFLGAHSVPKGEDRHAYLERVIAEMLPEVAKAKLADSCDIFVDEGYFTRTDARRLLTRARELGLAIKVHADELGDTDSARLAAEMGALSADHLLKISEAGIEALARSETVAMLLPGTAFYLKAPHAPARRLIEAGARVAISTDFNPGTSMTLNLPAVMTIAALYLGMSKAELFAAVTYNAARALGLYAHKGTLESGMDADLWVMPFERFEECYYRFAWSG